MDYFHTLSGTRANIIPFTGSCPYCGRSATFTPFVSIDDFSLRTHSGLGAHVGHRSCPNPRCQAYIICVRYPDGRNITIPSQTIDFDKSNVPTTIANHLKEAIICHANECFFAAAIMVRRTIEDICADHDAKGSNLEKRIESLKSKVMLNERFFSGMHKLRMLGNDAAHTKIRTFTDVGEDEVRLGIELSKRLINNIYQYDDLITKLEALEQPAEDDQEPKPSN